MQTDQNEYKTKEIWQLFLNIWLRLRRLQSERFAIQILECQEI